MRTVWRRCRGSSTRSRRSRSRARGANRRRSAEPLCPEARAHRLPGCEQSPTSECSQRSLQLRAQQALVGRSTSLAVCPILTRAELRKDIASSNAQVAAIEEERSIAKALLAFACLGPAIPAVLSSSFFYLLMQESPAIASLMIFGVGLMFGFIPALLAGMLFVAVARVYLRRQGVMSSTHAVALGALCGGAASTAFFLACGLGRETAVLACIGTVSGMCCAAFCLRYVRCKPSTVAPRN